MADIIEQMTPQQLRNALRGLMSAFTLMRTGETWDATDADGADLVFEADGQYISDLREEFNGAANDLLPAPDSPYLRDMVALLGITPEPGEANESLWARRALALTEPSLGSPVALHDLLTLSVDGVVDVSFITQANGSQNVYLVSAAPPPGGQSPGIPTAAQNAAALALVNNGRSHHVGRPFQVVTPTARVYSIVLTVYYDASEHPDVAALQERLSNALKAYVVNSRRLGVPLTQFDLYVAAKVEGVGYTVGSFYTGNLSGLPASAELLMPPDDSVFYTCAETVNHVASISSGVTGEINLIWVAV